jgi:hypothetical protein
VPRESGIFEPEEEFGAESGSGDCGGEYRPTSWSGERVAEAAAEGEVDAEGDEVGESFEEDVRVEAVSPKVDVDGKIYRGEMEEERDGKL